MEAADHSPGPLSSCRRSCDQLHNVRHVLWTLAVMNTLHECTQLELHFILSCLWCFVKYSSLILIFCCQL